MAGKIVAYYRVSTKQQGESGLGLEAQQAAVRDYATRTGSQIVREYTEVESGKKADRPELDKAIAHTRRSRGVLCVAKLDRLARNVAFTAALMRSGVTFVCCDNPNANDLTIHILAAVAEDEAKRISDRTIKALAALVARGVKLGNPANLTPAVAKRGRSIGARRAREKADEHYEDLYPVLTEKRAAGMTLQAIAGYLNAEGCVTRRGKPWNPVQVMHVLNRAARLQAGK